MDKWGPGGDNGSMTDTDRTQWLSMPGANHVATYHGATSGDEECWTVVYLTTPAAYVHPSNAGDTFYCGGCDEEVTPADTIAAPSDGQGDPICAACLFGPHLKGLAVLTARQAADMSWWDGGQGQPTPEDVGALTIRL